MKPQKSPKQLRQAIEAAKGKISLIRGVLDANTQQKEWGLGIECYKTSKALEDLVQQHEVPSEYKVAVVGRFKAGKSSFVNGLLGRNLAGENTNPETAAVTTFIHGTKVKAVVRLIAKPEWEELKKLHSGDPKNLDAQRLANWVSFAKSRPGPGDGDTETFDESKLAALEAQYLTADGLSIEINLDEALGRKGEAAFRKELKKFTSSSTPHHCLVQTIAITVPSDLLDEGVLLIDTPGLDDTESFRVSLTASAVEGVDAILFLTQSGASYGQSEKDFLLTLLRKGTVKQLVFVITQVDKTYDQHLRQCRDEDETPDSIAKRIEIERRRIEQEVEGTLTKLGEGTDSSSLQRYREQLGDVEVIFTSAANHRDWIAKDEVNHPLRVGDPGGMIAVKGALLELLSTESRLAATARAIETGAGSLLESMLAIIQSRRTAIYNIKNREEAERKLGLFRAQLAEVGLSFEQKTGKDSKTLTDALEAKGPLFAALVDNILLQAESELVDYETRDSIRHWKTRRGGRWGYMSQLQTNVANAIFPKVASLLSEQQKEFLVFIDKFKAHLGYLSSSSATVSESLELGPNVRLDVADRLSKFLQEILSDLQSLVSAEEQRIITLLDEFVTKDVEERIIAAREAVSDEWGTGTTYRQTEKVRSFYSELKALLKDALRRHIEEAHTGFSHYLNKQADLLPEKALGEITAELERMQANITASAEATMEGKKAAFDELSNRLTTALTESKRWIHENLAIDGETEMTKATELGVAATKSSLAVIEAKALSSVEETAHSGSTPLVEVPKSDFFQEIQRRSTHLLDRFSLKRGAGNWAYPRIFSERYFKGAQHVLLVDPYLSRPHQLRNLSEFFACARKNSSMKTVRLITAHLTDSEVAENDALLRGVATQLESVGVNFCWDREHSIHDRFVVLDTGILFKLGRGLDIYKSASGLALSTPELRTVHECEIDVFSTVG